MSKQREALELALDALDCIYSPLHVREINKVGAAMVAIREALAEPEQKPVAVVTSQTGDPAITMSWHHEPALPIGTKLYAAPPTRKPLTDEEIRDLWSWSMTAEAERTATTQQHAFARAIERAHGIGEE